MKHIHFIAALLIASALVAGCTKETPKTVDVSCSYVTFTPAGGKVDIQLSATSTWNIDTTGVKWVKINPAAGDAGQYTVSFTADSTKTTNSIDLNLACGGKVQIIKVLQQTEKQDLPITAVKDIKAGATYRAKGVASGLYSPQYGNFYLTDDTGSILVYGLLDKKGQTKSYPFESWGIEAGDIVEIEGYVKDYSGTLEFVDAECKGVTKSLLKIVPEEISVSENDTTVTVKVAFKGDNLDVDPQVDWIALKGLSVQGDTTVVSLSIAANEGKGRSGEVTFSSALGEQKSAATLTISQAGGNLDIKDVEYGKPAHVIGKVTGICKKGFILTDDTASILFFNNSYSGGYTIGDEVEINCSQVVAYKNGLEIDNAKCSSVVKLSEGSGTYTYPAPRVLAASDIDVIVATKDTTVAEYVSLTGELSISGSYCNIIVEGTSNQGSLYQITDEMKATLTSGKKYEFIGYRICVTSSKYVNILITKVNPIITYNKVSAITSGKQYLMVFADTLALDNLPNSGKSYGYPTASACKAESGVVSGAFSNNEYTFTAVAGGYNIIDSYGRFVYLYRDGAKSFNIATEIPASPENCGVWTVSFGEGDIATISNVMDSSWIQYNPEKSSAASYKAEVVPAGAIMPVLYEKE